MSERVVGLLVGRENTFPGPFLDVVNAKGAVVGVRAEMAVLGGARELEDPQRYAVIVDRISHEVPYYRAHLKSAALQGTVVVNDPFWWEADEKFFECTLARKIGVTAYTGLPAVLKPNTGGGWKDVHVVGSIEELIRAYDTSGQKTMILQEFIDWQDYVRCICVGRTEVLPIRYDPRRPFHERYRIDEPLSPELYEQSVQQSRLLVDALGYDMDTVEFAVRDGVLYAIDFLNPAPDFDNFSIKEDNFGWVLDRMSDLVIRYALGEAQSPWQGEQRWWRFVES